MHRTGKYSQHSTIVKKERLKKDYAGFAQWLNFCL